jgi:two-component system, NtrC family, sensor kinase
VDVHRTVEKAVAVVRLLFSRREIEFSLQLESCSIRVRGNEVTLEQALIQVLRNAAESMPNGGVVTISSRCHKADSGVYIEIRDQGGGMTRAECQQAILPFFRTKSGDHIGLGLTTAFRIVDVHGGGMELTSTPGEGTTVTIRLPVESRQA